MKKTSQQIFGTRLALLRAAHGMSQEQVAKVLNVSRSTYSYYESGKSAPSLDSLRRLIHLFCEDRADYLLLMEDIDEPTEETPSLFHDEAKEPAVPVATLSQGEKQMLAYYRVLSGKQKEQVMQLCTRLAAEPMTEEEDA